MAKIYTKQGDKGLTSLVGGTKVQKDDPRVELYGMLDELNSRTGYASSIAPELIQNRLIEIQRKLFVLQGYIACEVEKRVEYKISRVTKNDVLILEDWIDEMEEKLSPLTKFILPGGSVESSAIHLCRTCCRTIERRLTAYSQEKLEFEREFINRLSDYYFVSARYTNMLLGIDDVIVD